MFCLPFSIQEPVKIDRLDKCFIIVFQFSDSEDLMKKELVTFLPCFAVKEVSKEKSLILTQMIELLFYLCCIEVVVVDAEIVFSVCTLFIEHCDCRRKRWSIQ